MVIINGGFSEIRTRNMGEICEERWRGMTVMIVWKYILSSQLRRTSLLWAYITYMWFYQKQKFCAIGIASIEIMVFCQTFNLCEANKK